MAPADDARQGGEVYHGHEKCMEKATELLETVGLPAGLLPLEDVEECGIVRDTGFVWILSRKKVEHYFKLAGRQVRYGNEITAYASERKLKKLKGVRAKEMLLWVDINEIEADEPASSGKIHFKALGGLGRSFPVEAFAAGQ